jgi:hypothetical protein
MRAARFDTYVIIWYVLEYKHLRRTGCQPRQPVYPQPRVSSLQNSNRYNPGNRNRRNSPRFNNLIFSNRYKIGGSDDATSTVTLPALTREGSEQQESKGLSSSLTISTRNTRASRNHHNHHQINNLIFSTRNKLHSPFLRLLEGRS